MKSLKFKLNKTSNPKVSKEILLDRKSSKAKPTVVSKFKSKSLNKVLANSQPRFKVKSRSLKKPKLFKWVFILLVFGLLGFGVYRINALNNRVEWTEGQSGNQCKNILNPECWTEAFKPQLKQTNGYTNALIVGLDTRAEGGGLLNTDTLIVASFNHETQKTMLISIPRDFYVKDYGTKVNAVYALTYKRKSDDPYYYLKETVGKITGKQIHYLGTIHLEGVIEAVDKIGGIDVNVEKDFVDVYPYIELPADYQKNCKRSASLRAYCEFYYKAGVNHFDGQQSLIYARMRYYSSDFYRARRQQQVIEAVKDKLLKEKLSVSERAERYWSLMNTFKKSVKIDITFEDLLAGLTFLDSADRDPVNIVLDPAFGGFNKYIYSDSSLGGYYIRPRDDSYAQIQAELKLIGENADFYKEQPIIVVRNQSGADLASDHKVSTLKGSILYYNSYYHFNEAKTNKYYGIKVIDFTSGAKPGSLAVILKHLGLEAVDSFGPEEYGVTRSSHNEDFLILVGPNKPKTTSTVAPSN